MGKQKWESDTIACNAQSNTALRAPMAALPGPTLMGVGGTVFEDHTLGQGSRRNDLKPKTLSGSGMVHRSGEGSFGGGSGIWKSPHPALGRKNLK